MRSPLLSVLSFIAAASAAGLLVAAEPGVIRLEAIGTTFRATLPDGTVKEGPDLVGTVLVFLKDGARLRVRIAAVAPDPQDRTGAVFLHDFRLADTDAPLCDAAPDGQRTGFPLAGRTEAGGRLMPAEPGAFELICASGAQGKCVRFGYHPWETTADGRSMRDLYDACVRMVRADYCGDGRGWTRDGMAIDIWDDAGIQVAETRDDPHFSFEAGWTPDGAICVAHTRVPENITVDRLRETCPRFAAATACDEATAREAGAILYNRSP